MDKELKKLIKEVEQISGVSLITKAKEKKEIQAKKPRKKRKKTKKLTTRESYRRERARWEKSQKSENSLHLVTCKRVIIANGGKFNLEFTRLLSISRAVAVSKRKNVVQKLLGEDVEILNIRRIPIHNLLNGYSKIIA